MVFPKEPELITMEKLLIKRIDKLFEAIDNAIGDLFDDITDEIEMLLQLAPPIYEELMIEKRSLTKEMNSAIKSVSQISELARDDIYKQRFVVGETNSIEWDFRKDYTQAILNVMGKYQLIPFESPFIGEMNTFQPETEIEEVVEPEEVEQPPVQQQKLVQTPVQPETSIEEVVEPEEIERPPFQKQKSVQKKRKFEV